jgi:hypothetical protein
VQHVGLHSNHVPSWLNGVRTITSADAGGSESGRRLAPPPPHRISRRRAPHRQRPRGSPSPTTPGDIRRGWVGGQPADDPFLGSTTRTRPQGKLKGCRIVVKRVSGVGDLHVSRTRCSSTNRSRVMRNGRAARPTWWATSAVPYRYFWLLPSAGVVIGLAAASMFGVPVWLGFLCAEIPALALEAWWRRAQPPSGDNP